MDRNKIVAFCVADKNNLKYYEMMLNSLRKFHSEEELPVILIDEEKIAKYNDQMFFYRATPIVGLELLEKYETVLKLDADQIITGDISHAWEGNFDVAVVNNSNPREMKAYPVTVWDIHPLSYVNCGFVVMKSKPFLENWKTLCFSSHFNSYQMREQDLLNILVAYGNYKVRRLDEEGRYHGLASKGYWPDCVLKEGKLYLPQTEGWPPEGEKQIVCLHWAGGNSPDKMNYKLRFQPEVIRFLDKLVA